MADLDELDNVASKAPSTRKANEVFPGVPDGEHEFTIISGELKEPANGFVFYVFKLLVTHNGQEHEGSKEIWIKGKTGVYDQDRVSDLKRDLKTIGCSDIDEWTNANMRPFSREIKRVGQAIVGCKVKGKISRKADKNDPNKVYTTIYLNKRVENDGSPAFISAEVIEKASQVAW